MESEIASAVARQRAFFDTGVTLDVSWRLHALETLRNWILENEAQIDAALKKDLNKTKFESYMTEVGMVLDELRCQMTHVRKWSRKKRVRTPLAQFPARSFIAPQPYGVVLVMAPWNYPFLLSMAPLLGAVAAGNCVILKPSEYAPETARVMEQMVLACFDSAHVRVIPGGQDISTQLLSRRFDSIFFTGSTQVGKIVMEHAAKHLTPVTLELGGKSPCIVDETADVRLAARRIAFGKCVNAGQTCVAPDYVLIHEKVKEDFIAAYKAEIRNFFGEDPVSNANMPHIIDARHTSRLKALMEGEDVVFGGQVRENAFAPTLLDHVSLKSPIMQEEIFGPLLPLISIASLDEAIDIVRQFEKPLALYLFTRDAEAERRVLNTLAFGGGCINDTLIHLATTHMPFGGVGMSGMGAYHGKKSFDTFTHKRSIVKKSLWLDLPMRYHPYTKMKELLVRLFLK